MTRVGLVQLRTPDNHAAAFTHVEFWVRRAAEAGAQIVLTPEGTNILQRDNRLFAQSEVAVDTDPVVQGLRALAVRLDVQILIGSAFLRLEDGRLVNRCLIVDENGEIIGFYGKAHMFDVSLPSGEKWAGSKVFSPGRALSVVDTRAGLLGLNICYDIRQPHLYRALAERGADTLAVPAAFTRSTGTDHWKILLQARLRYSPSLAPAVDFPPRLQVVTGLQRRETVQDRG